MALGPLLQNERGKAAEMEKKSIFSFLGFRLLIFWNSGPRNDEQRQCLGLLIDSWHTWHPTNRLVRHSKVKHGTQ